MIKKHAKDLIVILVIAIVLTVAFTCMDIKTPEQYYSTPLDKIENENEVVFFSIDCKTLRDRIDKNNDDDTSNDKFVEDNIEQFVSADGIILKKQAYNLREGDTAFSILQRITSYNKIPIGYKNNAYGVYVEGINHIFEKSCKGTSGWVYLVNGKMANVSCSSYKLKPGDYVEWRYTCEYGDLGGNK